MKKLRKQQIVKKLKKADGYIIDSIQLWVCMSKHFDECYGEVVWDSKRYSFTIEQVDDVVSKIFDLSFAYSIEHISGIEDFECGGLVIVLYPSENHRTNISADVVQTVIDCMNKQVDVRNQKEQEELDLNPFKDDLGMP